MKHLKIFIVCVSLFIVSCEQEKVMELETNQIEFKNFDISPDLELSFEESFNFGLNDMSSLKNVINEYSEYLFAEKKDKDEKLYGFDITISKNKTVIKPITIEVYNKSFSRFASCPKGYENLGTCYSASCVRNKVQEYFTEHEDDFANGPNISFQLVNHMGGKRVCGRTAPAITPG